jgi:hypothetical protein
VRKKKMVETQRERGVENGVVRKKKTSIFGILIMTIEMFHCHVAYIC